jgi:hypothetical protein
MARGCFFPHGGSLAVRWRPRADGMVGWWPQPTLEEPQPQWVSNVLQAAATARDGTVRSGMMRAYVCVSPALANELCACAQVRQPFVWWALVAQLTENTTHVFLLLRRQGQRVPLTFVRESLLSLSLSVSMALMIQPSHVSCVK